MAFSIAWRCPSWKLSSRNVNGSVNQNLRSVRVTGVTASIIGPSPSANASFAAAESANMNGYTITSGYRSYERQAEVYAESKPGYAQKPGCSEHQTGRCFDVTVENVGGFETTPQYDWLRLNAHKYGFIQRYPANKSGITGISYEPWHYRYVGVDAATYITAHDLTLEEYLGK